MDLIDLRSDTVTKPDAAMRRAMAEAEVGDDVYGEDPTVRRLEEESAAALGFPAAMFVPSGIMGNQIGLRLITPRGTELLCDQRAHVLLYEMGALAALSGILARPLPSDDGLPAPEAFRAALVPPGGHRVPTGAIEIENSQMSPAGGPSRARDSSRSSSWRARPGSRSTSTARASGTRRWRSGPHRRSSRAASTP
jgi:threonine aldolase